MTPIDWGIVALYLVVAAGVGFGFVRRTSTSLESYYLGDRRMPWWLLGVSMAATTFAADTPLAVTELFRNQGLWGNWLWWNMLVGHVLVGVLFARLWRRSGVLTDAEIIELRYSGSAAVWLRGVKAVVIGILLNALTMGWVMFGMAKVASAVLPLKDIVPTDIAQGLASVWPNFFRMDWSEGVVVLGLCFLALLYSSLAGLVGVAWMDLLQFFVALGGTLLLALVVLCSTDGQALWKLPAVRVRVEVWPPWGHFLPVFTWVSYLGWGWWAHKYADGGGYIVARLCASRNDADSGRAMLLFVFLHYIVRPWPWIFVAAASLVAFPQLADASMAYPQMMLRHLPAGLLGLMVTAFLAAFLSTINTHIHWGSSYWVNDLYRRFWVKNAPESHYVCVARFSGVLVVALAVVVAATLSSITSAWKILYLLGSGLGPVVLARWLWWRVSAAAELASFFVSLGMAGIVVLSGTPHDYGLQLALVAGASALVWLPIVILFPEKPSPRLQAFFYRVLPPIPGWRIFTPHGQHPSLRHVLFAWGLGVIACIGLLYGLGMLMFGPRLAGLLFCLFSLFFASAFFRLQTKMEGTNEMTSS